MALAKCKSCGKEVSNSARRCPHCGGYLWSRGRIGCAVIVLFIGLIFYIQVFHSCIGPSVKETSKSQPGQALTQEQQAENERFQREFAALVEKQRQEQNQQKIDESSFNQKDNSEAKQKLEQTNRDAYLRKLEFEKKDKERQLQEKEAYHADLQRQIRENAEQQRKGEEKLKALQRQQKELDESTAGMIRKIKGDSK